MASILEVKNGTTTLLPGTTWAAPNGLFGATDRNDGTAYGWADSTSTITLPASGLADGYAVLWGFEFEDTSNGRHNPQGRMVQASGTGNFASAATGGYNRDNSEDRSYVSGWSFVDSPSASATLQFQWRRDTDAPTGGTVRSFIQVIPLYYSDVGIYTSTSTTATGGTTPVQIGSLTGVDGTNITVSSSTVTMTGDNKRYLCLGSGYHQGIGSARTQRWFGLRVDGTKDDAAKGCQYYRQASDADGGESFIRLLETVTASRTVDLFQYRGDGVGAGQGGADVDGNTTGTGSQHALVVIELNDSAEVYSSVDSVGGQEFALAGPVDVDIASTSDIEFNDAASFTRSTDTGVNIETDMDVFAFANVSHAREASSIGSGSRWTVHGEFTINGTEVTDAGFHGNYNRGNQTSTDCMGSSCNQAGVFAVTTGQDIGVSNQELSGTEGGNGDIETQPGWVGFGLINLDTMEAATTVTSTGSPSIPLITASGTATDIQTGTGSPSIPLITASGSEFLWPRVYLNTSATKVGATEMTVTACNAAGTSITFTDPIGAPTGSGLWLGVENQSNDEIDWIGVTVNAGVDVSATGSPSIPLIEADGTSVTIKTATGSPSIPSIIGSGNSTTIKTSIGAAVIPLIVAAGLGVVEHTATGAPQIPLPEGSGSATTIKKGDGSPSIPLILASGNAEVIVPSTGAPEIPLPVASGSAVLERSATGSPVIPLPVADGDAAVGAVITGTGSPAIPLIVASGDSTVIHTADGAVSIPLILASGKTAFTASGSPSIPLPVADGVAEVTLLGVGNPTIPLPIAAGTASLERSAFGSPAIPLVIADGSASVEGVVNATGAPEIPLPVAAGTAVLERNATGAVSIPLIEANGTGTIINTATGSTVIPLIQASGNAERIITATSTSLIPIPVANGVAEITIPSVGNPTIPLIIADGTGSVVGTISASGTAEIPLITASGTATVTGVGVVEEEEAPSGGWAALNAYDSYRQRKRKRDREREEYEKYLETLEPVSREIGELLQEDRELAELTELVESLADDVERATAYNERVGVALERAVRQGNYSAVMAFGREMDRAIEEEEFVLLAIAILS